MIKLKENKGVLLITTFLVAAVISVISGVYVTSSIVQSNAVQREKIAAQDFYAVEKGIAYAFVESQNHSWSWNTYTLGPSYVDQSKTVYNLTPSAIIPTQTLIDPNFSYNTVTGCYEIQTPSGPIQIKTYPDPDRNNESWVLSRKGGKMIRFKLTQISLYRYLFYYPSDQIFKDMNINGNGYGGIYVNGNIALGNTNFTNITELTTNTSGAISLQALQYTPPYQLDASMISKSKIGYDGQAPLPQLASPNIYMEKNEYPWSGNRNWPPTNWPPYDWRSVDAHFYTPGPGSINGITLPRTLATPWDWDRYSSAAPSGVTEQDVKFYDGDGKVATDDAYWNPLAAAYPAGYFDQTFWDDKTYKRSSGMTSVYYLNTDKQAGDWKNWLDPATGGDGRSLNGIVKEKNTGAYNIAPLNIQQNYTALAQANGIYINQNLDTTFQIWVNGVQTASTASLPSWIKDNVQFFNTVRPKLSEGVPVEENVLKLDIQASFDPSAQVPNNGIIYIANRNLMLVNGAKLPKSLTVISPYNIYIQGDYNTDAAWQPAAVISNSYVYLLSNSFKDPSSLPALSRTREYPFELSMKPKGDKTFTQLYNAWASNPTSGLLTSLQNNAKNYFSLNSFDISSSIDKQPTSLTDFQNKFRQEYYNEYAPALMPDLASNTTYQVAIATPYAPTGYELERWVDIDPVTKSNKSSALPSMVGAFIQLEQSWANQTDASGNPILDASGNPIPIRDVPAVYKRGQSNMPVWINDINPAFAYETRFASPGGRTPSGDFLAGSRALWQEMPADDYNFNRHISF